MAPKEQLSHLEEATHFQQIASDPAGSAWVSANAGSGKTYVLVNRIIRLMLDGALPEKILCLTFTKAAAAEMSNRLYARLSEWISFDDVKLSSEIKKISGRRASRDSLAKARKLFALSLETPGGLKIQTIHGFCESLLHRFPIEAGLTPGFDVLEEAESRVLKQEARNSVLARAMENRNSPLGQALDVMISHAEGDRFDQILDHVLKGRKELAQNITQAEMRDRADLLVSQIGNLRTKLGVADDTSRQDYLEAFAQEFSAHNEKYKSVLSVLLDGSINDKKSASRLEAALSAEDPEHIFSYLYEFYYTTKGEPRTSKSLMTQTTQNEHPDEIAMIEGQQDKYVEAFEELKKIEVFEANRAAYLMGDAVHATYEALKRRSGSLDFDDLISHSCDLFKRVSAAWVLYKIDGGLDHILVDEAQDTSAAQWQIISAVAEEFFTGVAAQEKLRSIFAVGDEKQSIYSFQGADPSQFDKMRSFFAKKAGEAANKFEKVPLSVSFRSTAQVLSLVDRVFDDPASRKGLTHSGEVDSHIPTRIGQAGLVELWETIKPQEKSDPDPWDAPLDWLPAQSPSHMLAEKIASQIKAWLDNKEILEAKGRPIEPGDILILVRRRKIFFEAMLRALKSHHIPVAGADRMALSEQMAVNDLVALGRVMLLKRDDLSLACVLKSPFFGLSEEQIFELSYERQGQSLWQRLKECHPDIYQTLIVWEALSMRSGVFDFYATILNQYGGRRQLIGRLGEEANDPIDEFLSLALTYDQTGGTSLQEFIHKFSKSDITITRDMEHGKNEVRLMTVHGAKGLEGNIVFLPETCDDPLRKTAASNLTSIRDKDDYDLPLWALSKKQHTEIVRANNDLDKEDILAEHRRLLYVALTRARDRLYICGYDSRNKRSDTCWYNLVEKAFTSANASQHQENGHNLWRLEEGQNASGSVVEASQTPINESADLPIWARENQPVEEYPPRPLVPSRLEWSAPHVGHEKTSFKEPQNIISPLDRAGQVTTPQLKRGIYIHHLLQYLPDITPEDRRERAEKYLAIHAAQLGERERAEMIDEVFALLDNETYAQIFSQNSKAEVPVSALIEPSVKGARAIAINGQIDRLIVSDDEVLIIDYKTNRPPPAEESGIAPVYVRQMAAYRLVMQKIYPERKIKCAILWTYTPQLMFLSERILDNAFTAQLST